MMRINCSFTLEPDLHDNHFFAAESLRFWLRQEKKRGESKEIFIHRREVFHRALYLSGLYLYKLLPNLPEQVANILTSDKVNYEAFKNCLSEFGIENFGELDSNTSETDLSLIKQQLQLLVDEIQPTVDLQSQLNGIEASQQHLQAKLEEINGIESECKQAKLPIDKMATRLAMIEEGQEKLMLQLSALRKQLNQSATVQPTQEMTDDKLVTQLERASRIKGKGIW